MGDSPWLTKNDGFVHVYSIQKPKNVQTFVISVVVIAGNTKLHGDNIW